MYVHESWFCGRVQTQTSDECLPYSWEETQPGAAEDDRSGEGKVLLLLLAGPQLHRQRERNISTHDGGAGWRAWSTGTTRASERPSLHGIEICFLPFLVYSFILWEYDCFDIFCFFGGFFRFKSSRERSLHVSCSASREGWSSTQERGKRRRKIRRVSLLQWTAFNFFVLNTSK